MLTVSKMLDELIDDTLQEVARYDERGFRVSLDGTGLPLVSTTTCSLVDASRVDVSDVIEFGSEMVLITGKTADVVPILTVSRGYDGSTAVVQTPFLVGTVNPQFSRRSVAQVLKTAMTRLDAARIFVVTSGTFFRTAGKQYIEMPSGTRQVLSVAFFDTRTYRYEDTIDGWQFFDNIPTTVVTSGKIIRVPRYVQDDDSIVVTYRIPYRWSSYPLAPVGTSTITLPEGAEDLPALYASARLVSRREMSRLDIDRSEEWNKSQAVVNGVTSGMLRQRWQEWYKALEEAKSLNVIPIPRPYTRMRRVL